MCGIAGLFAPSFAPDNAQKNLRRMMHSIRHRGPDANGVADFPSSAVYLGHHRLSIIDLSTGAQPMASADGQLTITFNGEIYNYKPLREQLLAKGHKLRTHSDTEVLLYAYREWGTDCLQYLNGMYSFAIWDQQNGRLFCARDRIGIKPFYFTRQGDNFFAFASEIKALLAIDGIQRKANPDGLHDYLTFQFCLQGKTMFQGIEELPAGHFLTLDIKQGKAHVSIKQYWDLSYNIDREHDEAWFCDQLRSLIDDAVKSHLQSDVPLGAHLSGGLDSSTVASFAARLISPSKLNTYTGAFREGAQYDETPYAKLVASQIGASYHETYISGETLPDILPKLIAYMDQPAAGPGLIPQYFVSQYANKDVTVVLGGQGGDEIFAGYARYVVALLEQALKNQIDGVTDPTGDSFSLSDMLPHLSSLRNYEPMLQNLFNDGLFGSPEQRYFKLIDRSSENKKVFSADAFSASSYNPYDSYLAIFNRNPEAAFLNKMLYFDLKASLPALLHVEDRTSMAASLESRVPFVDHRIVEFMATVPPSKKMAGGEMKALFKKCVEPIVPQAILARKDKMGFPTPLLDWSQGVAREFVYDILFSQRTLNRGLYNKEQVNNLLNNKQEFGRALWGLLCLELWHRHFIDLA